MRVNIGARLRDALALAVFLCLITTKSSLAADIAIDGQFGDWVGKPNLADPAGDVSPVRADLVAFYWTTNPGDPTVYFMIQRMYPGSQGIVKGYYRVFVNGTCNGSYTNGNDRAIYVTYDPSQSQGLTTVDVYAGNKAGQGPPLATYSGNWGDSLSSPTAGGTRTEFGVPFANLGFSANQQLCFWLGSYDTYDSSSAIDLIPGSGEITWTPIPALDYPLLALVTGGVIAFVWKRKAFAAWQTR